jgi:hypothetical protein
MSSSQSVYYEKYLKYKKKYVALKKQMGGIGDLPLTPEQINLYTGLGCTPCNNVCQDNDEACFNSKTQCNDEFIACANTKESERIAVASTNLANRMAKRETERRTKMLVTQPPLKQIELPLTPGQKQFYTQNGCEPCDDVCIKNPNADCETLQNECTTKFATCKDTVDQRRSVEAKSNIANRQAMLATRREANM